MACNDSTHIKTILSFHGFINGARWTISAKPEIADFDTITAGQDNKLSVTLTNLDSTAADLVVIDGPQEDFIKAEVGKYHLSPGESTTIDFSISSKAKLGHFLSSFVIEAKDKKYSRLTIPIQGTLVIKSLKSK